MIHTRVGLPLSFQEFPLLLLYLFFFFGGGTNYSFDSSKNNYIFLPSHKIYRKQLKLQYVAREGLNRGLPTFFNHFLIN